jgi:F0F1-type ATP synthase membrane subunit b/b'
MMRKNLLLRALLVVALLCSGVLYAQKKPVRNISGKRHPNLAAAQRACNNAFESIKKAQEANEFDMGGHAQKAKDLLEQADKELKEAAEAANKNKEK